MDVSVKITVSATIPDWSREQVRRAWDPSRKLLKAIRDYQALKRHPRWANKLRLRLCVARHRWWATITGSEIDLTCDIQGGLLIPHPNGIVIHPQARIGPNCLIFQQVTIGAGSKPGIPKIGGHVDIGAGAKILGGVTIGDHAVIGANAVVMHDVSDGQTVVGIPARPIRK